jgi:hypothetical protein
VDTTGIVGVGSRTVVVETVRLGSFGVVVVRCGTVTAVVGSTVVTVGRVGTGPEPATAWPARTPRPTRARKPAAAFIPRKLPWGQNGYG